MANLFGLFKKKQPEPDPKVVAMEKALADFERKAATFTANNEYARHVLAALQLNRGVTAFDYNLEKFVRTGYIENPHVYSVINKIIQPASTVPWLVYKVTDKKQFNRYISFKAEGKVDEAELYARKSLEVVENTPFNKIFEEEANEFQSWNDFVEEALGYYELTGNNFIYGLQAAGLKYFTKLYNLPSQAVEIIPAGYREPVKGYRIYMNSIYDRLIEPTAVIHRKKFNPNYSTHKVHDLLYGLAPLSPLQRTVGRSNEGLDAMWAMLQNGFPPGILSDATTEWGNPLQEKDIAEIRKAYTAHQGGGKNANMPIISPIALAWTQMGLSPVDLDLLEADKLDLKTIAGVYNVAIPLVSNDGNSIFGSDINAAEKYTWQNARIPALTNLRDNIYRGVVKPYNKSTGDNLWIDFDLKAVPALQEDKTKRGELHLKEVERGIWTGKQYLELMDYGAEDVEDPLLNQRLLSTGLKYTDVDKIPEKYRTAISVLNSMSPLLANQVVSSMTEIELRDMLDLGSLPAGQETIRSAASGQQPSVNINQ